MSPITCLIPQLGLTADRLGPTVHDQRTIEVDLLPHLCLWLGHCEKALRDTQQPADRPPVGQLRISQAGFEWNPINQLQAELNSLRHTEIRSRASFDGRLQNLTDNVQ